MVAENLKMLKSLVFCLRSDMLFKIQGKRHYNMAIQSKLSPDGALNIPFQWKVFKKTLTALKISRISQIILQMLKWCVWPEELPVSSKSMLPRCRTPATTLNRSSFSVLSRPIFFMAPHILLKSPWSSTRGSFRAPTFRCWNTRVSQKEPRSEERGDMFYFNL